VAHASTLQRKIFSLVTGAHARLYRRTGGRFLASVPGSPVLLLTTTGRRSGEPRTVPLAYLDDAGRFVVCGSYGGSDTTPAWVLNLAAHPAATVEVGRRGVEVTASEAEGEEYDRLWARLVAATPAFAGYRTRTTRHLPLLVLTPAAG